MRGRSKRSRQSPPPSAHADIRRRWRGRVGWGRRRFSSTRSSLERTPPTPTLPQLGGGGRAACSLKCDSPAPLMRGRERKKELRQLVADRQGADALAGGVEDGVGQ